MYIDSRANELLARKNDVKFLQGEVNRLQTLIQNSENNNDNINNHNTDNSNDNSNDTNNNRSAEDIGKYIN